MSMNTSSMVPANYVTGNHLWVLNARGNNVDVNITFSHNQHQHFPRDNCRRVELLDIPLCNAHLHHFHFVSRPSAWLLEQLLNFAQSIHFVCCIYSTEFVHFTLSSPTIRRHFAAPCISCFKLR
ncbi:unnamed protein product [Ceratitis capitata]|uniref:(Mediterranean fruit fly) hypothetical protein n=1 Tax=Ceratitis capitata TaxID=7213 RepID=A0A811TXC2_CERCA|nr:unnamed protein product [Ceratitis capitata]